MVAQSRLSSYDNSRYKEFSVYLRPHQSRVPYFRALVIGDSRLWGSDRETWDNLEVNDLQVCAVRGGKVDELSALSLDKLKHFPRSYCIIKLCFGLNDILSGCTPELVFNKLLELKR